LPKEKNHSGGIKDPYAEAGTSLLPDDNLNNKFKPVADIKKYLTKHPNNIEDDYFFITINTQKNIYYCDCDAKLDFKGYTITNHSMQSLNIHGLVETESMKQKFNNDSNLIPLEEAEPGSHLALADETSTHKQALF
ncbi:25897_t:CDS:2, partial [Gigaspora margarita]